MYAYRITKYDPRRRDATGAYQGADWTSWSDVGSTFAGHELTIADYLAVEDAYVATVRAFADEAGVKSLVVRDLEPGPDDADRVSAHALAQAPVAPAAWTVHDGDDLPIQLAEHVCRLVLREALWCRLVDASGFYVHVGHDYYMYVGTPTPCPRAIELATAAGLFVEPFPSPYRDLPSDQA